MTYDGGLPTPAPRHRARPRPRRHTRLDGATVGGLLTAPRVATPLVTIAFAV
ncbi:hypothetical protein ACFYVW_05705 [Streptomyces tendae]|uniref:hypothetical protein n=1 Tax=Streptomyces tendae TaxID=1932 RepID=UPI0036A18741